MEIANSDTTIETQANIVLTLLKAQEILRFITYQAYCVYFATI